MDVLLGSDSLLTAEGSLLRELRVARELGLLSDERLRDAIGPVAARRLGVEAPSLAVGARADVIVLRRPLLEASEEDVVVVIADGVVRVLDPVLVPALGAGHHRGRIQAVGGVMRWIGGQGAPSSGGGARPTRTPTPVANSRSTRS